MLSIHKIKIIVICIIAMLFISNVVMLGNEEVKGETKSGYTSHSPIYINGNENFTSANGVSSGDGSQGNPYIIEGWDISASSQNGIEIRNTDKYFVIRNVYVRDGKNNLNYGIYFYHVSNGKIENSEVKNNNHGIYLYYSSNNNISGNNVYSNNIFGINLYSSSNNNISGNNVYSNNGGGIYLYSSSNNKLRDNILNNNSYNFGVGGGYISHYYQNIDTSNKINGKPIYYIQNQSNLIFNGSIEVGYFGFVNCVNITVKNYELKNNNREGILFANTTKSLIENNNIFNNGVGIALYSSSNNNINGNNVYSNNYVGIFFDSSSNNNIISGNNVSNNNYGIYLWESSKNNRIYLNNFMNNTNQAYDDGTNNWDYSGKGNYWDDYIGSDNNNDGIGEDPYPIQGGRYDFYPLMKPINNFTIPINQIPTVSISYPSNSQTVKGTITIIGKSYDSDGTIQKVEIKIDNGNWQTASGTTSWTYSWDTKTVSDGTHTISARSFDGIDYSNIITITIIVNQSAEIPNSVSLSISEITSSSITLSWSKSNENNFLNYTLFISTDNQTWNFLTSVSDRNTTSFTVSNLNQNTTYYFKIRVYNSLGLFNDSNIISGKTTSETTQKPTTPILYILIIAVIIVSIAILVIFLLKRKPKQPQIPKQPYQIQQPMQQKYYQQQQDDFIESQDEFIEEK